jgi:LysM repeat protein
MAFFGVRPKASWVVLSGLPLAACGTASPLPPVSSGPSWSLSRSNADLSAPRGGTLPTGRSDTAPAQQPQYSYRGGRDPVTGRALTPSEPLPAAPRAVAQPGSLPDSAPQRPVARDPGVRAVAAYKPIAPGTPYTPAKLETVRKGERLTVMQGDTITAIAHRHRVSVAEIMRVNSMTTPILQPGQQVLIPER